MELTAGARLGSYEIVGPLGSGGMGDVYRARDTKLGRDVAIKVLPSAVALDAVRLKRFEQEARAAGALNHPNLVTVHEFGVAGSAPYIVMELIEGETLRSRLNAGAGASRTTRGGSGSPTPGGAPPADAGHALPVRKSLDYATQIATGLAAAHDKGIVHRDLKPENVVIAPDGRVKILDFGLAKVGGSLLGDGDGETGLAPGTAPGTVLGTVGYMAPEQVRGEEADHRADVFSLGAILYEMLTGRRAFRGATSVDTLHAILRDDPPDLTRDPAHVPAGLARLVQRCLEKSPAERYQSARDLAFNLAEISNGSGDAIPGPAPVVPSRTGRRWRPLALALACAGAGVGLGWLTFRTPPSPPVRFDVLTYSGTDVQPAASPDGRTIAFSSARSGVRQIWLKQVNGGGETALTAGPNDNNPRFSPDGASLIFQRVEEGRSHVYRVAALGGNERRVLDNVRTADWSPDGTRLAYMRATEAGGVVGTAKIDGSDQRDLASLENGVPLTIRWSPDGRWLACQLVPLTGMTSSVVQLVPVEGGERRTLSAPARTRSPTNAGLAWNGNGRELLFVDQPLGAVGAQIVAHDVAADRPRVLFSVLGSPTTVDVLAPGVILFDSILQTQSLRTVPLTGPDREGSASVRWLTRGRSIDRQPAFSPDGGSIVFASNRSGNLDLWTLSTRDGTLRRLTDDAASDWDPAYSPDGSSIVWSSDRSGNYEIWMASADGSGARQVSKDGFDAENPSVTRDDEWIVYASAHVDKRGIWKVRPDGTDATLVASGRFTIPEVSPDGRFVAFHGPVANGRRTIDVHRVDDGSPVPFTISIDGRGTPDVNVGRHRWMPDGRGLAFWTVDTDGVAGVFVQDFVEGRDTSSTRRRLAGFDPSAVIESFGIAPDGTTIVLSSSITTGDVLLADGLRDIAPTNSR